MKPVSLILSLLLLGPLAEAFQSAHGVFSSRTLSHDQKRNEKHLTVLASTKNSTTETEENLSGLVNGMLKTHREMAKEVAELSALNKEDMPKPGTDGIYRMVNEKQFRNFLTGHSDQLVIVKFSSPFCKACKMLKQKFRLLHQDPKFQGAPVVIGDISLSNNKHAKVVDPFANFVTSELKVSKIPTLHFYVAGELVETIECGPEGCAWTRLKPQMVDIVDQWRPALLSSEEVPEVDREQSSSDAAEEDSIPASSKSMQQRIQSFFSGKRMDA